MHCKHDKCRCQGTDVKQDGYCSENCRKGTSTNQCNCGHAGCK